VTLIGDLIGRELAVAAEAERVRPEASEVDLLVSDPSRARQLLGWEPKVELRDGLARTMDWIERNAARYRTDHYVI
jgi:nucleoside-diphosphate-sugar epimerase